MELPRVYASFEGEIQTWSRLEGLLHQKLLREIPKWSFGSSFRCGRHRLHSPDAKQAALPCPASRPQVSCVPTSWNS